MGALADVRGEGGASVNDCKKYTVNNLVFLGMATRALKTNHSSCASKRRRTDISCFWRLHFKKRFAGCHSPNSPWPGINSPVGDGKNRKPFFTL
jgi:hypothetical protein